MDNLKIAKILALSVIILGFLTMIGWIFGIDILKSNLLSGTISTKFMTATSFVITGIMAYVLMLHRQKEVKSLPLVLGIGALLLVFFMATSLFSQLKGVSTGIEHIFVAEEPGAVATIIPGAPSIGTIIGFLLTSLLALLVTILPSWTSLATFWFGILITVVGGVAVLGYILGVPVLYYAWGNWTNPIAFKTAVIFTVLGLSFLFLGKASLVKKSLKKARQ